MSGRRLSKSAVLRGALAVLAMGQLAAGPARAGIAAEPAAPGARAAPAGHVQASLVAEHLALVPGRRAELGVLLAIDPGWHVYAQARNDSGLPVAVRPELPAGWVAQPLQWPAPHRHLSPGPLLDHVYEGEVLLLLPVDVPADAPPGATITLRAHVEWMVCQNVCLTGEADVELALPVAGATQESGQAPLFRATRARLPEAWPQGASAPGAAGGIPAPVSADLQGDTIRLTAPGALSITLLPAEDCVELPQLVDEGAAQGAVLVLHLPTDRPANARLRGCVEVLFPAEPARDAASPRIVALDLPVGKTSAVPRIPADAGNPPSPSPTEGEH
ncbi:MAG TPA: protein-disulfide reductase DsbD domain-containing protein [Planctomycetota bacterium]|nr:protein-disulfide reductase DsbD domain-containing protein [Planctomycetota bacterium]